MTRKGLVAANWKMHGQAAEVAELLAALVAGLNGRQVPDIVICPPAVYIPQAQSALAGTSLKLGCQNVFAKQEGAYTGEISARMLRDFDCSHVIVGHSERRELFAETDELVAEKFIAIQAQGLIPILCVGETLAQRESGSTAGVIRTQLDAVIHKAGIEAFASAVVAYEPVWAIGTGISASAQQTQEVHAGIRAQLAALDEAIAEQLPVLYGGSVKAGNAAGLFEQPDIDGALVGGASLVAEEFLTICAALK